MCKPETVSIQVVSGFLAVICTRLRSLHAKFLPPVQ
jgi:hypothetical protein